MNRQIVMGAAALVLAACASGGPSASSFGAGFSATAYIKGGRVDLIERTPTIEPCEAAVRAAATSSDPSALGRVVMGEMGNNGDVVGICGGPDGRMYFITRPESRLDQQSSSSGRRSHRKPGAMLMASLLGGGASPARRRWDEVTGKP